jgi:hypothetical protein
MKQNYSTLSIEHLASLAREAGAQVQFDYLDIEYSKVSKKAKGLFTERRGIDRRSSRSTLFGRAATRKKPIIPIFKL